MQIHSWKKWRKLHKALCIVGHFVCEPPHIFLSSVINEAFLIQDIYTIFQRQICLNLTVYEEKWRHLCGSLKHTL